VKVFISAHGGLGDYCPDRTVTIPRRAIQRDTIKKWDSASRSYVSAPFIYVECPNCGQNTSFKKIKN